MTSHDHTDLIKESHEWERILLLDLAFCPIDSRQRKMRVGYGSPKTRKMFGAGYNPALREFCNKRRREPDNLRRTTSQTSIRHHRIGQAKIHDGCEVDIETRGRQFRRDNPGAKP